MKFRLSKLARKDLDDIYCRSRNVWGERQAERYIDSLWSAFERIAERPGRWRLQPDIHPECRICFSGRHAVIYRIRLEKVEISRVLHDAMDYARHIPPAFFE